jgi:hypothetical protein
VAAVRQVGSSQLETAMTVRCLPLLLLLLASCAARVTHPTKNVSEMQADIDLCTDNANRKYWMDPVAALYNAYDCLEAKGYQRASADTEAKVERALGEGRARHDQAGPVMPCQVPCRAPKAR